MEVLKNVSRKELPDKSCWRCEPFGPAIGLGPSEVLSSTQECSVDYEPR